MSSDPTCPSCGSAHVYTDGSLWICPDCSHEWAEGPEHPNADQASADDAGETAVIDSNGNRLIDGDSVILIKDLKVKGSSSVLKGGTKVKSIRLTNGADGHNIACKIDGVGALNLKSEFVRKA